MAREIQVTKEGYARLQERIEHERTRLEEATRILQDVSAAGDDYDDTGLEEAKREKVMIEDRLDDLEDQLARAVIIKGRKRTKVALGSRVKVKPSKGSAVEVQVVASIEAGVLDGDIPHVSDESPLGQALIGHEVGDKVEVSTGTGTVRYEIKEIT